LLVWGVNAASLVLATALLPGVWFDTAAPLWWSAAVLIPIWFSLGVLFVRPLMVLATLPLNAAALGLPTLLFNGLILHGAAWIEPAFHIDGLTDAFWVLVLFTVINTAVTGWLGIDEVYPFFQTLLKRVGQRYGQQARPGVRRGMIILQVDGLSWRSFMRAVRRGRMPATSALMGLGTHRLHRWQSGVPSNTPAVQSGLFYGSRAKIPGYRWYDRAADRVLVSSSPSDLREAERAAAEGRDALLADGSCINSLLSGGAAKRLLTLSVMRGTRGDRRADERADFNLFWLNPWAYTSAVFSTVWEFMAALVWMVISRFNPRKKIIRRTLRDAAARAVGNAFLRETAFFWLEQDVARGVPIIYSNFVGYDEVAHMAGPDAGEAQATLTSFDRKLQRLRRQLQRAPVNYDLVLLADHGQSPSIPFRVVTGQTLEELVTDLSGQTVPAYHSGEIDTAYVNGLLADLREEDAALSPWIASRSRRTLERIQKNAGHDDEPGEAQLVVCISGGLAHLYRRGSKRPLLLEEMRSLYPGLVEGLVSSPGIGLVVARDSDTDVLALGRSGVRNLTNGLVVGDEDPLTPYWDLDLWSRELSQLATCEASGDLVILAKPLTSRRVVTFEEQVGTHGGVGGPQNEPFILLPAHWSTVRSDLSSPEALYGLLMRHREGGMENGAGSLHSSAE
jgi:uncharacterized membrane protein YvlD (DUF360 family)